MSEKTPSEENFEMTSPQAVTDSSDADASTKSSLLSSPTGDQAAPIVIAVALVVVVLTAMVAYIQFGMNNTPASQEVAEETTESADAPLTAEERAARLGQLEALRKGDEGGAEFVSDEDRAARLQALEQLRASDEAEPIVLSAEDRAARLERLEALRNEQ